MIQKLRKRFSGGFTLIEVLIMLVVIAIVASIAIPSFLAVREKYKAEQEKVEVIVESSKPKIEKPKPEPGIENNNEVFKKL